MRERDLIESLVMQFAYHNDHGQVHTGGLSVLEEAFDYLGWDDPHDSPESTCREPGCGKQATCGWLSTTGYRWTCYRHSDMGRK